MVADSLIILGCLVMSIMFLVSGGLILKIRKQWAKTTGIIFLIAGVAFMVFFIVGVAIAPSKSKTEADAVEDTPAAELTEAEKFAQDNCVSLALAEDIEYALSQSEHAYKLHQVYEWKQIDDWAAGPRYTGWMDMEYIWVFYVKDNKVASIRQQKGLEFVYQAAEEASVESTDGSIHLVDGELGEYGRKDSTYPEYVDYYIPEGRYSVSGNAKNSIVMIIDNSTNDEISRLTLAAEQSGEIEITSNQHIELTIYSDVTLTEIQ